MPDRTGHVTRRTCPQTFRRLRGEGPAVSGRPPRTRPVPRRSTHDGNRRDRGTPKVDRIRPRVAATARVDDSGLTEKQSSRAPVSPGDHEAAPGVDYGQTGYYSVQSELENKNKIHSTITSRPTPCLWTKVTTFRPSNVPHSTWVRREESNRSNCISLEGRTSKGRKSGKKQGMFTHVKKL